MIPRHLPRKKKNGMTEYVIKTGKAQRLDKTKYAQLKESGEIDSIGTVPISWIGVPLFINSESIGALVIQSYNSSLEYNEKDLEWLSTIINLVATAIERKTYLTKILEEEKKYKAITNSTKDAIITVDEKTRIIILWNRAAEKLFGYTEAEVLGKSTFELIIPERFKEESRKRFKDVISIGKDFEGTFNIIAKKKDGTEFEVELSISLTEIGNNWFSTGIWRDVSKKKEIRNSSDNRKRKDY